MKQFWKNETIPENETSRYKPKGALPLTPLLPQGDTWKLAYACFRCLPLRYAYRLHLRSSSNLLSVCPHKPSQPYTKSLFHFDHLFHFAILCQRWQHQSCFIFWKWNIVSLLENETLFHFYLKWNKSTREVG